MNNNLIDNYVYAVIKLLPYKIRDDVELEIKILIEDMLETRCLGKTITEKDVQIVLLELGLPEELADKYNENRKKALISAPYYQTYVQVLKIVVISFVGGLSLAYIIMLFTEAKDGSLLEIAGEFLFSLFSGAITAFAIVTLIFAALEYKGVKLEYGDSTSLYSLPDAPKKEEIVSRFSCYISLVGSVVFILFFLMSGGFFPLIGKPILWLNMEFIHEYWYLFVLFFVLHATREIVKLVEGRYTKRVLIVTILTNATALLLVLFVFARGNIFLTQNILAASQSLIGAENEGYWFISNAITIFWDSFVWIIVFALLIDIATTTYKYFGFGKKPSAESINS